MDDYKLEVPLNSRSACASGFVDNLTDYRITSSEVLVLPQNMFSIVTHVTCLTEMQFSVKYTIVLTDMFLRITGIPLDSEL